MSGGEGMNIVKRFERGGRKVVALRWRGANTGTVLRMRCVMAGCLGVAMLAAACAPSAAHSSSPSPTPAQTSSGSPSPTVMPGTTAAALSTPVGTPGIGPGYQGTGGGAEFPAQDTLVSTMSLQQQGTWEFYVGNPTVPSVPHLVPGLDAFSQEPPLPTINQPLPAGLSAGDAQQLVVDTWKTYALEVWALDHGDTGMLSEIDPGWVIQYSAYDTENMAVGADVSEPACDWYPKAVTIVSASSISAWLQSGHASPSGAAVQGPYALVTEYAAAPSCTVTITKADGSTSTVNASGPAYNGVEAVVEETGAPLGDYAQVTDVAGCQSAAAVVEYCQTL